MHHRPARAIVTILVVALLATTFGGAAEGKRAAETGLALPTTTDVADRQAQWCGNMSNAPQLRNAASELRGLTIDDEEPLAVLDAASQRPIGLAAARRIGSEYAALSEQWSRWDQLCTVAYAGRA